MGQAVAESDLQRLLDWRGQAAETERTGNGAPGIEARIAEGRHDFAGERCGPVGEGADEVDTAAGDIIQMQLCRPLAGGIGRGVLRHRQRRSGQDGRCIRRRIIRYRILPRPGLSGGIDTGEAEGVDERSGLVAQNEGCADAAVRPDIGGCKVLVERLRLAVDGEPGEARRNSGNLANGQRRLPDEALLVRTAGPNHKGNGGENSGHASGRGDLDERGASAARKRGIA